MHAVTLTAPGDPDVLVWTEVPDPVPGPGEVLIEVAATAVNRADLLQRMGFYPPPPGASEIRELGADIVIDYRESDFVAAARDATGTGVDVILDIMGASYLSRNVDALAPDGRLLVIGLQGGATAELDLGMLLSKRASVHATTL